jgi:epoxyqueuosine reductase
MPTARALVVAALGYESRSAVSSPDPPPVASTPGASVPVGAATASGPGSAGRLARYVWADHYQRLQELLEELARPLRTAGYRAQVLIDSNHLVDRNVAWRAGLGWYGKNSNLLLPGAGSWYVLGSILTDAPLDTTDAPLADGCGPCRHCIDDCPTQAIIAPGIVDARRCIAWLVQAAGPIPEEFRVAVGDRIYGCDDCQEVCPPNRVRLGNTSVDEPRVDISWLLTADDDDILARYGRWYIADRNVDVIRRTALVVLGNVAHPGWGEPLVTGLLRRYLTCDRPLVRNHAVWAARRLGLSVGYEAARSTGDRTRVEGALSTGVPLPACCSPSSGPLDPSGEPVDCPDLDLHRELVAPIEARFDPAQWAAPIERSAATSEAVR